MAKREIRVFTASSDVAAIIDRGADIDAQIKSLGSEDKGIKTKLTESAQNQMSEEELSLRLVGAKSAAVVSGVEKIDLDAGHEQFPVVRAAIDKGLLEGVIEREVNLSVPPGDVEKAAKILKDAGIKANIIESLKITAEDWRVVRDTRSSNADIAEAEKALLKCVKRDVSYRVKYEKI